MTDDRISAFLDRLAYERGLSENTRRAYGRDLARFSDFARRNGLAEVEKASGSDIVSFLDAERAAGASDTTLARRFAAIRVFFSYLAAEGVVPNNPAETLRRPKTAKRLPETLTEENVGRIVEADEGGDAVSVRNHAIMELLYASGLRASELVTLTVGDVFLDEAFLRCRGKGSKERVVPVGEKAVAALREYLASARPELAGDKGDSSLFLTRRGTGMCRETLWRIVRAAADKAGLAGAAHPHTMRHCFATHLLEHGANIRAIQEMLGHANIATTQIYTHVDASRLAEVHRRFHPRG